MLGQPEQDRQNRIDRTG
jgi:hypothetical protein